MVMLLLKLQENEDEDDEDEDEEGSEEDEDEVEPKLKYERIGNAMNTILNGEECASCMAVHTKVLINNIYSSMNDEAGRATPGEMVFPTLVELHETCQIPVVNLPPSPLPPPRFLWVIKLPKIPL